MYPVSCLHNTTYIHGIQVVYAYNYIRIYKQNSHITYVRLMWTHVNLMYEGRIETLSACVPDFRCTPVNTLMYINEFPPVWYRKDSNLQPSPYRDDALTIELLYPVSISLLLPTSYIGSQNAGLPFFLRFRAWAMIL